MPTIFPITSRTGTWTSPAVLINQGGAWQVTVIGVPQAQYEDLTQSLSLELQRSDDGVNWATVCKLTWVGGPITLQGVANPATSVIIGLDDLVGHQLRILGNNPQALTFGLDVTRL